jgi:hypothetical protein
VTTTSTDTRFCSVCARQVGLDPGGHAGYDYTTILAIELPLPWPLALFSDPSRLPDGILAVRRHIVEEYRRIQQVQIGLVGIAPDKDYSIPGMRRAICWRRPDQPFAQFGRSEYLAPEAQLGPLAYALAVAPERLSDFDAHLQGAGGARDLLVCTHGSVDAACSKFGYPTYAHLRRIAADSGGALRAWRATHFGGHVFAPTLIDLPHGSFWAYIEREEAELLAGRNGDVVRLRDHYRGWAGLNSPFLQVLERELFVRYGWAWLGYAKSGRILSQDEAAAPGKHGEAEPSWAEVRLDFRAPDGARGAVTARVELATRVEVIHTSGGDEAYAYPQYAVAWLRDAAPEAV